MENLKVGDLVILKRLSQIRFMKVKGTTTKGQIIIGSLIFDINGNQKTLFEVPSWKIQTPTTEQSEEYERIYNIYTGKYPETNFLLENQFLYHDNLKLIEELDFLNLLDQETISIFNPEKFGIRWTKREKKYFDIIKRSNVILSRAEKLLQKCRKLEEDKNRLLEE